MDYNTVRFPTISHRVTVLATSNMYRNRHNQVFRAPSMHYNPRGATPIITIYYFCIHSADRSNPFHHSFGRLTFGRRVFSRSYVISYWYRYCILLLFFLSFYPAGDDDRGYRFSNTPIYTTVFYRPTGALTQ